MTDTDLMDWMERCFTKLAWRGDFCHVWGWDAEREIGLKGVGRSLRAAIDNAAKGKA